MLGAASVPDGTPPPGVLPPQIPRPMFPSQRPSVPSRLPSVGPATSPRACSLAANPSNTDSQTYRKPIALPRPPQTPAASFKRPYRKRPGPSRFTSGCVLPAGALPIGYCRFGPVPQSPAALGLRSTAHPAPFSDRRVISTEPFVPNDLRGGYGPLAMLPTGRDIRSAPLDVRLDLKPTCRGYRWRRSRGRSGLKHTASLWYA